MSTQTNDRVIITINADQLEVVIVQNGRSMVERSSFKSNPMEDGFSLEVEGTPMELNESISEDVRHSIANAYPELYGIMSSLVREQETKALRP